MTLQLVRGDPRKSKGLLSGMFLHGVGETAILRPQPAAVFSNNRKLPGSLEI